MRLVGIAGFCLVAVIAAAQTGKPDPASATIEESYQTYTDHPRLLLNARRLRLLRRERERQSPRWQQLEMLIAGRAQMAEPGFAMALVYQVGGERQIASQAIEWALRTTADIRQVALVYDWCQPALTDSQRSALETKLRAAVDREAVNAGAVRDRAFAALAIADVDSARSSGALESVVQNWWRKQVAPRWREGQARFTPAERYALLETLHVIRDNLNIDLREDAGKAFGDMPAELLLSYYPAAFPAAENEYRVPAYDGNGDPDLRAASLARAAELAIVAYDSNLRNSQFLQGWLMHDQYVLRSPFGAPYEFLWANPYLPGLSYYHMPLFFHDGARGDLYARSSWDDDALWFGYRDGRAQLFENGRRMSLTPGARAKGVDIGDVSIIAAHAPLTLERTNGEPPNVFVVGLKPGQMYLIEVDGEELAEVRTDAGGILAIPSTRTDPRKIRVRERQ